MIHIAEKNLNRNCKSREHVLKFNLVGDGGVGKSQLLNGFMKKKYNDMLKSTVGIEFASRDFPYYEGSIVRAQVWDCSGIKLASAGSTKTFFDSSVGVMLVYDSSNRTSFVNCMKWMKVIRKNTDRNIAITLVANKVDIATEHSVSTAEGAEFARQQKLDFISVSARTGLNVEVAFRRLIMMVASLLPEGQRHNKNMTDKIKFMKCMEFLPDGIVRIPSLRNDYECIWTGERISIKRFINKYSTCRRSLKTCVASVDSGANTIELCPISTDGRPSVENTCSIC